MKYRVLSISMVLTFILSSSNYATEYVVNQKNRVANDAGPGTKKEPFKTIGAAVIRVKAGDKILISAGIYRDSVELKTSGTEGNPITIEAADRGKVIMKGSVVVTDWKREPGNSPVYLHEGWTKYFGPVSQKEKDARAKSRNKVFSNGTIVEEVFQSGDLKENSFFIDKEQKQIHLWLIKGEDPNRKQIEVADQEFLFHSTGNNYITILGIRF